MPRMSWPRARLSPNACCCHRRGAQRCGPQPQHSVMFLHIRQPAGEWHVYCVTSRGHTGGRTRVRQGEIQRHAAAALHIRWQSGAAADSAPWIAAARIRRQTGTRLRAVANRRTPRRISTHAAPLRDLGAPSRVHSTCPGCGRPNRTPSLSLRARRKGFGRVQRWRRDSCGAGAKRRGSCRVVAGACSGASPVRTRAAP